MRIGAPAGEPSLSSLIDLEGRTAVVTGASKGIGAAVARRLAEAGARVVLSDIDVDGGERVADELDAEFVRCDITVVEDLVRLADAATAIDIWINNAGVFPPTGPVVEVNDAFLQTMFDLNIRAQYQAAREAARRMRRGGTIVNVTSTAAFRGGKGISAYAVSKHAVVGITRSLACDLGPSGVRVVAVAPGIIDTPGVAAQLRPLRDAGVDVEARIAANPLGLAGRPDHVARVVLFLVSGLAEFVTGSVIPVEGGSLVV